LKCERDPTAKFLHFTARFLFLVLKFNKKTKIKNKIGVAYSGLGSWKWELDFSLHDYFAFLVFTFIAV
jgi:hypothetical protein